MKRSLYFILAVVLITALMSPTLAFAGKGNAGGTDKAAKATSASDASEKAVKQDKTEAKAAKSDAKAERKGDKAPQQRGEGAESEDATPHASVEATRVAPGKLNAFARITANLEKSVAKIADGTKTQLPPGLVRVWLKFAGWLGIDPSTMPGTPSSPPTEEPTSTVEPTATVEPTGTVEPTPTVEPVVVPSW